MRRTNLSAPTGLALASITIVSLVATAAAEPPAPEAAGGSEPVPVVSDDPVIAEPPVGRAAEAAAAAELKVRYAMARLRLAELDLERAVAANAAVKGAVGEREIERLRNHVSLMHRQLEIAREQPRTAARQATVAAARMACDNARADLDTALKANHRTPGAISDLNLERLRARLELAEIRVALCENPAYELSLLDEMQWNIDQLTDQLIDLRHQVETRGSGDFGKGQ